jgi:hypothetical protein
VASGALQEMEATLHQFLSFTLWTYYLFIQSECLDWSQPLLTVHSALPDAQLLEAAEIAGVSDSLLKELATYVHQYVGVQLAWLSQPTGCTYLVVKRHNCPMSVFLHS